MRMTAMSVADLNNHHREKIFAQPSSGDVERRQMLTAGGLSPG